MALSHRPADDVSFKSALGSFASSVNVITVRDAAGNPTGMTATAFCSVSMDPLLVLICVNSDTRTHHQILRGGGFGVNVLSESGVEVSSFCARPGLDKLIPDDWLAPQFPGASAPALNESIAFLDCEVYRHFPAGTHGVIIGRVRSIALEDEIAERPLLFYRGKYHGVAMSSLDEVAMQAAVEALVGQTS